VGGGRHSFRTEVTDDMGREAKAVVLVLTLALQTRVRPYNNIIIMQPLQQHLAPVLVSTHHLQA
jgi:hypothetical protein